MKLALYKNYDRRHHWLIDGQTGVTKPKIDLHLMKTILSVWWRVKGIIHWETLQNGYSVTASPYCQQLDRIAEELKGEQDRIQFLYDNARSHVVESIPQKLLDLRWIFVSHLPYSPHLIPTDYHLYRSLLNHLRDKKFSDESDLEVVLLNFFDEKSQECHEHRILSFYQSVDDKSQIVMQHILLKDNRILAIKN